MVILLVVSSQKQQARHSTRNAQAIARGRMLQQKRDLGSSDSAGEEVVKSACGWREGEWVGGWREGEWVGGGRVSGRVEGG